MEAVTGKRMQKQTDRNVVEQSGEPFLLSYRCDFSHTAQCACYAFPGLRRLVGPPSVPKS